jgi:hypothetical protein
MQAGLDDQQIPARGAGTATVEVITRVIASTVTSACAITVEGSVTSRGTVLNRSSLEISSHAQDGKRRSPFQLWKEKPS